MSCLSGCSCTKKLKNKTKILLDETKEHIFKNADKTTQLIRCSSISQMNTEDFQELVERLSPKEHELLESPPERKYVRSDENLPGEIDENGDRRRNDDLQVKVNTTKAYGMIKFQIDATVLIKPSKYIRLSDSSNMEDVVSLMQDYWKMNEPNPPKFIISVTGSVRTFMNRPEWEERFGQGLVDSLITGDAWLFTGGLNFGLMKVIGEAIRRQQSLMLYDDRMINKIQCVGVAQWGCVEDNHILLNNPEVMHGAEYKLRPPCEQEKGPASLNPFHTHFLLIDDGNKLEGTEKFRVELMDKISEISAKKKGLIVPSLLLVVGGDLGLIEEIALCLQKDIPVLLLCGAEDLADILVTEIYRSCFIETKSDKPISEEDKDLIRNMLNTNYKEQLQNKPHLLESLYKCIEKMSLIHTYEMNNSKESLDLQILLTAIMHQKFCKSVGSDAVETLQYPMKTTRPDITKRLCSDYCDWIPEISKKAMTLAILKNRVDLIRLLLERGIVMKDYLTVDVLNELYNKCIRENEPAFELMKEINDKDDLSEKDEPSFTLKDVSRFLKYLLRYHSHSLYTAYTNEIPPGKHFEQPFRELFLWAIVVSRTEQALFFWRKTREPLKMAIVATAFYWRLDALYKKEKETFFAKKKKEFEEMAISVLEECGKLDWKAASRILNTTDPYWGDMTPLDLAIIAYDRAFMSTPTFIKISEELWFGRLETTSFWKVYPAFFIPLLITVGFIRFHPDPKTGKKPNIFEKVYYFYTSPASKMVAFFCSYICFLALLTYVVVFEFKDKMEYPEIILNIWILNLFLDIGIEINRQPSHVKVNKLTEWLLGYSWNILDAIWMILFAVGFTCRLVTLYLNMYSGPDIDFVQPLMDDVHLIYVLNCIVSYIRVYEFYMVMPSIGPKLIVLKRMIADLIVFFLIAAVSLLCYGIGRIALICRERQSFWVIFEQVISPPFWHLFGEVNLEGATKSGIESCESDSSRNPHAWIVPILLGVYMFVGNILLVNMLIAVFSKIFDDVNENSKAIYRFQFYVYGREISRRYFLPAPFLIIECVLLLIYGICAKIYAKIWEKCESLKAIRNTKTGPPEARLRNAILQMFEKEARLNYLRKIEGLLQK